MEFMVGELEGNKSGRGVVDAMTQLAVGGSVVEQGRPVGVPFLVLTQ